MNKKRAPRSPPRAAINATLATKLASSRDATRSLAYDALERCPDDDDDARELVPALFGALSLETSPKRRCRVALLIVRFAKAGTDAPAVIDAISDALLHVRGRYDQEVAILTARLAVKKRFKHIDELVPALSSYRGGELNDHALRVLTSLGET